METVIATFISPTKDDRLVPTDFPTADDVSRLLGGLLSSLPISRRKLRAGEVLFHQGDPGESAQIVLSGLVGLEVNGRIREPMVAVVLRPGDVAAPERLLLPGTRHETTGRAMTDCEVRLIRSSELEAHSAEGELRAALNQIIANRTVEILDRLIDAVHLSAAAKVAGAVCRLAGDNDVAPVSQDVVAATAGVVRVTANAELGRLADRRLVRLERRRITILDRPALERSAR